jgi:hypothetical protein
MRLFFSIGLCFFSFHLAAQLVSGRILDGETREPVPYAVISDKDKSIASLSNDHGFFILQMKDAKDSIFISCLGYIQMSILIEEQLDLGNILLEPQLHILSEVNISPAEDDYLFEILDRCRRNQTRLKRSSKAFFELKSFDDFGQTELIEGYFNVHQRGGDIMELEFKTGRVGLQKNDHNYFLSLDGSKAITLMKAKGESPYFPDHPLAFAARLSKRKFWLYDKGTFRDALGHRIMLMSYRPKSSCGSCFEGRLMIDLDTFVLRQVSYVCSHCSSHPFVPLFPDDFLDDIHLNVTKNFDADGFLEQVQLSYKTVYISRKDKPEQNQFTIRTQALLSCYGDDKLFFIPRFVFPSTLNDYRKMAAIPDNPVFWQNRQEFQLDVNLASNEDFYNHPNTATIHDLAKGDSASGHRPLRYDYVHWSTKRIRLGEVVDDTIKNFPLNTPVSDRYRLVVQIYVDVNAFKDSLQLITSTVFDPYRSFYYLPKDSITQAFVNMYFDLVEVQRRKLHIELLDYCKTEEDVSERYDAFIPVHDKFMEHFLREVDRGTSRDHMKYWNEFLIQELGIDNLNIFGVYQD